MTEKGIKAEQNAILRRVVMVFQPFLIYYIVNIITVVILTALVDTIIQDNHTAQAIGGTWKKILVEQKATVNAVIGGLSMLSGILPLFSTFRSEIMTNNSGCNLKWAKEEEDSNRYRTAAILKKIMLTITLAFTSSIAINILFITLRLTESSETYHQTAAHQYSVIFPAGLFLYGIVSPFAEEVVFRGIIYNRLKKMFGDFQDKKRFRIIGPMVISALLFGFYHGNIVQMLYGFLMGVLIACVYEKGGRLLYAFLFHAAANAAVYVITGNPFLYGHFITPCVGLMFAAISVLIVIFWRPAGN